MRQHPLRVFVDQLLDRASQLGLDLVVAVGLENRSLGFHHLGKGPIADALSVRQRSSLPPIRQLSAALDRLKQLADQPALADTRHAGDPDQLRRSLPSSAIQSRIASAARTARSGSSSRVTGAPNSAITASPMNFSTVPPQRSSSYRSRSWYGASTACTSSGSSCSARDVKPTRSANRTVRIFRSA